MQWQEIKQEKLLFSTLKIITPGISADFFNSVQSYRNRKVKRKSWVHYPKENVVLSEKCEMGNLFSVNSSLWSCFNLLSPISEVVIKLYYPRNTPVGFQHYIVLIPKHYYQLNSTMEQWT